MFGKCALRAVIWIAGGSPAAGSFLLLAQKKGTKEKGPPSAAPSGYPALLAKPGGCATRTRRYAARAQTVLADFPRLVCATRRRIKGDEVADRPAGLRSSVVWYSRLCQFGGKSPSAPLRIDGQIGEKGEHCSSSAAARALCGLPGRVAQPPNLPVKPKVPEGRRRGCPFLWYLSFGQAKERYQPPGCSRQSNTCAKRTPRPSDGLRFANPPYRCKSPRQRPVPDMPRIVERTHPLWPVAHDQCHLHFGQHRLRSCRRDGRADSWGHFALYFRAVLQASRPINI